MNRPTLLAYLLPMKEVECSKAIIIGPQTYEPSERTSLLSSALSSYTCTKLSIRKNRKPFHHSLKLSAAAFFELVTE